MSSPPWKDVSHLFKKLESPSASVVFQGLLDIRNKLLKTPNGTQVLRENNGVKYLLKFVKKHNEKILDVTLSILANLCLVDDIRTEVGETNGLLVHLVNLVTHVQRDSIQGRTCRLIGNLASNHTIGLKLHHKGVVSSLVETIKSSDASPVTKHMAVRALRVLWEIKSCRVNMITDQAIRAVASLLSTPVDELLQAVLKALANFTHVYDERCALQVQGDGNGFEELVATMKHHSNSYLAASVVLNLCMIPEIRPLLGTAGLVNATIEILNSVQPDQFSSDLVTILCLLCRESVNRSKVRREGGLDLLLAALSCGAHTHLETKALNAILHFVYDEVGLQLMIQKGLVTVLVQILGRVVETHACDHCESPPKCDAGNSNDDMSCPTSGSRHKRLRVSSPKASPITRSSPQRSKNYYIDCDPLGLRSSSSVRGENLISGHWSPGSSRSMELSPDSLRTCSPPPLLVGLSPSSSSLSPLSHSPPPSPLSDAYSPVCGYSSTDEDKHDDSDEEAIADCEGDSDCETASPCLKDKEDIQDIKEALSASVSGSSSSRHGPLESWCLLMLSRVSHMDSLVDDMVSSKTVDTLLHYYSSVETPHPRAARVLHRLTRNHNCLLPLLRSGFVLKVNSRLMQKAHERCTRCSELDGLGRSLLSQMSVLAESGYGEGEITHQLLRSTRSVQALLTVSVPYVIKARKLLCQMMSCKTQDGSALELLLKLLTDEYEDGLMGAAVDSVSRLAHHVGVCPRQSGKHLRFRSSKNCADCTSQKKETYLNWETSSDYIVLELDDGATIPAKREELCRESPMFCAMLTGGFCESGQRRIFLKDVSKDSLSALLCLMSTSGRCQCRLTNSNADFAFDVLKLADRFIMKRVISLVGHWLLSRLAPEVVPTLYMRSQDLRHVLSFSEDISKETLHFALGAQIESKQRLKMFSEILQSDYRQCFIDDINSLVRFYMER